MSHSFSQDSNVRNTSRFPQASRMQTRYSANQRHHYHRTLHVHLPRLTPVIANVPAVIALTLHAHVPSTQCVPTSTPTAESAQCTSNVLTDPDSDVSVMETTNHVSETQSTEQSRGTTWCGPLTRSRCAEMMTLVQQRSATTTTTTTATTQTRDPRCGMILFDPFRLLVLLVLNRVKHNNDPPKWSLPKGLQERWELQEKCALRELDEETGFNLSIRYLRLHSRKVMIHQNTYYVLWVDSTKIRLEPKDVREIERAEFVPLHQLTRIDCNCDLRRWRDQDFPKLMPPHQGDIVSIWGQSPLRFLITYSMEQRTTSHVPSVVVAADASAVSSSSDAAVTPATVVTADCANTSSYLPSCFSSSSSSLSLSDTA
jgi:ADP-ribose pyrophosphatase YjhB (NUDIX family)